MKVIKKINNNVAICLDANGNELIAFGNGIGFPKVPYEINDLSKISRTYYGVNLNYIDMLNEIPEDIFGISAKIVDYAKTQIFLDFNPNITFTLADHINFSIKRYYQNINVKIPFLHDIEHLYEKEMKVGKKSIIYINKVKKINLPLNEAAGIALHFINAENIRTESNVISEEKQIKKEIVSLIEKSLNISIDKRSFNYSRFITHIQYLLKRQQNNTNINSENNRLFNSMKEEFSEIYKCCIYIRNYIQNTLGWFLSDEEILYLMLHINRLCSREDCNL